MLGIVACTNGLRSVHLRAGEHAALRRQLLAQSHGLRATAAGHHLHRDDTDARVVQRLHQRVVALGHREVVGDEHDVQLLRDRGGDHLRVARVQAHSGEADLARLLRHALRVEQLVRDVRGLALAVQVPDVDVVGAELLQALVELRERVRLVAGPALRRDVDLVAPALERRADQALVVAALVAARGVEEVDAEVGGPLDDALVGGDHAAEGHLADLHPGLPELALADHGRGGGRRRRGCGRRGRGLRDEAGRLGGDGHRQTGDQEAAAAAGRGHGGSS